MDTNSKNFRYVCTATNSIGITEKTIEVIIHHHFHHIYIVSFIIIRMLSALASSSIFCHTFDFQVSIVTLPNLESEYRVKKGKNTIIFFIMMMIIMVAMMVMTMTTMTIIIKYHHNRQFPKHKCFLSS